MDIRSRAPVGVILLGIAAAGLALIASSPLPGVSVDSGEYLAVADGLRRGEGLTMPYVGYDEAYRILEPGLRIPMTQFPPLYPSLLAGTAEVFGVSLHAAARAIASISFAGFVMLGSLLVWRETRSIAFTLLAGSLLLAPDLVTIHAMAWSEQTMLLALAGAVFFSVQLRESRSTPNLVALGLCCIAASMARFAGVATIVPAAFVVGVTFQGPAKARLLRAIAFASVTIAPTIAWFVRNSVVAGAVSEKELAWHPPSLTVLGQAAQTIGAWLVPWRAATMTAGILAAALTIILLVPRRRPPSDLVRGSVADLCLLFGACYVIFLLAARAFLDQNIPFDARLLSPLQALGAIGLCAVLARMTPSRRRSLALGCLAVVASMSLVRGSVLSQRFSETTVAAYTSDHWRASETLAFATRLPRSTLIVTNAPDPLWFWDDRVTQILPPRSSLYSGEPNANYSAQLRELHAATACNRAVLVFFSQPTRKPPREVDPIVSAGLQVSTRTELEDGVVFEIDEPRCQSAASSNAFNTRLGATRRHESSRISASSSSPIAESRTSIAG